MCLLYLKKTMKTFLRSCNWIAPDTEIQLKETGFQWLVTLNPLSYQVSGQAILKYADYFLVDGIGLQFALRRMGLAIPRCAGIDWVEAFLAKSAPLRVALIGATAEVNRQAVNVFHTRFAKHTCVYQQDGYFEREDSIMAELKRLRPDVILVAMASPRQERFLKRCKGELHKGLGVGVGGTFDVWAGSVKRAPLFFQKCGLEWLFRMCLQPWRIKNLSLILVFLLKTRKISSD